MPIQILSFSDKIAEISEKLEEFVGGNTSSVWAGIGIFLGALFIVMYVVGELNKK